MPTDLLSPKAGIGWLPGMRLDGGALLLDYDAVTGSARVWFRGDTATTYRVTLLDTEPDLSHPGTLALVVSQCWPAVVEARASDAVRGALLSWKWADVGDAVIAHGPASPEHIAAVRALVAAVVDWRAR